MSFDYLHERQHKRELRLESAQKGTAIAESQQQDLERTLLFNLRSAFVQTLQAKALLANAKENLDYFDQELAINRDRFKAGDIAHVDLDRIELQRVQYESDYQTALVNMRTAKITLLMLLNERTPVDQFDVTGPFEFNEPDCRRWTIFTPSRWPRGRTCRRPCRRWTRPGRITNWRWPMVPPTPPSAWIWRAIRRSRSISA